MPDANVDATLNALVAAGFGAAGQRCTAVSTVIFVGRSKLWYYWLLLSSLLCSFLCLHDSSSLPSDLNNWLCILFGVHHKSTLITTRASPVTAGRMLEG